VINGYTNNQAIISRNALMTKRKIDKDDVALFRDAIGDVRRIDDGRIEKTRKPVSPRPTKLLEDEAQALEDSLSDHYDPEEIQPGDILSFKRSGIQNQQFRKLRSGHFSIQAELDLHGYILEDARKALLQFIRDSQKAGYRVLRIIHGKGHRSSNTGPVLKPMVNNWLRQCDEVLAFHSAQPRDGGTGAVYILIKRHAE
jgi:DNA-nicking Smr family endonuclease